MEAVMNGEAEDETEEEEVKEDGVEVKWHVVPAPTVTDTEGRRRNPMPTGRLRDPPCERCVRGGKECLEQGGKALAGRSRRACVHCAKIKMWCDNDKSHPVQPKVHDWASVQAGPFIISSDNEPPMPAAFRRS